MSDETWDDGSGPIEPNNTLGGLLAKLEDGRTINEFGAEVQEYIRELRMIAKRRRKHISGKVTIEIAIPMDHEGYMRPAAKLTTKSIAKPARPESTMYVDEDGDINGLPVPKQVHISEIKGGKNVNVKDPSAPAAKAM